MDNENRYFSVNRTEHIQTWLRTDDGEQALLISRAFDAVQRDTAWSRMTAKKTGEAGFAVAFYASNTKRVRLSDGTVCDLDALISNPLLTPEERIRFLLNAGFWSSEYDNAADISLHDFTGRYIWLRLKITGDLTVPKIRLYYPRNSFIRYLPESMQTGNESFFARFTAIFQALYLDLDEEIGCFHSQLNPESAPLRSLTRLACWLGLEPLLPIDESKLRILVSEAWELVPVWGTRRALSRVLEILCGEKPFIRECRGLDPYSFTVLLSDGVEVHSVRRAIEAIKPAHTSYELVTLKQAAALDANVYVGVNSRLTGYTPLRMDSDTILGLNRLG